MTDEIAQIPVPPVQGGWKALGAWGLSALLTLLGPLGVIAVKNLWHGRERRKDVLQKEISQINGRVAELEKHGLRKGDFNLVMGNVMQAIHENGADTKEGIKEVKLIINTLSSRFDAHIDGRLVVLDNKKPNPSGPREAQL